MEGYTYAAFTPTTPHPHPTPIPESTTAFDAVDDIVNDCFFSVGQAIGARKALDFEAVVWWREHFRAKFLRTLQRDGNSWREDRHRVTAVAHLLAERAVRHAGARPSIDRGCAMKAAADVEAYCALRATGRHRRTPVPADSASPLHAGYWCLP
jgi:hypothetical protein